MSGNELFRSLTREGYLNSNSSWYLWKKNSFRHLKKSFKFKISNGSSLVLNWFNCMPHGNQWKWFLSTIMFPRFICSWIVGNVKQKLWKESFFEHLEFRFVPPVHVNLHTSFVTRRRKQEQVSNQLSGFPCKTTAPKRWNGKEKRKFSGKRELSNASKYPRSR